MQVSVVHPEKILWIGNKIVPILLLVWDVIKLCILMIMAFSFLPYYIKITVIMITFQYILIFLETIYRVKEKLGGGKFVLEGNRRLVLQYNFIGPVCIIHVHLYLPATCPG